MSHLGIIGVGYVGQRLAEALLGPLWLLSRDPRKVEHWRTQGHEAHVGDLDQPETLPEATPLLDGLFYLAPPQAGGHEDLRMLSALKWLSSVPPQRIVYISTTGVYGDCQGDWVDETAPLRPGSERAKKRVSAEDQLRHFALNRGINLTVLRVPGIYGPERLPVERIKRGDPVLRPADAPFSNRIHVDDLVQCCVAAMQSESADGVYNVSDDQPSTMTHYFYGVADVMGLPRPPSVSFDKAKEVMGEGMLSYLRESRRVSNRRMHEGLGVSLLYPSLAEGLASLST